MSYNATLPCESCGMPGRYNYRGTTLPVCTKCYPEWRKTVPCDGCGKPALDNPIETESEDDVIYWWHYECWQKACNNGQETHYVELPVPTTKRYKKSYSKWVVQASTTRF